MITDSGKYFLYRHIRLDKNEPFYVGIGTKRTDIKNPKNWKKLYRRAFCKKLRGIIWKRIIAKTNYEVEILLESDDYEFIKQKEIEFIKLYGRKDLKTGTLANQADGGEGVTGKIFTEAEREVRRKRMLGNKNHLKTSEIMRQNLSKTVYQYNANTLKFIKKWNSCREAANSLNIKDSSGLSTAARNNKRLHNFIWSYIDRGEINEDFSCQQYVKIKGINTANGQITIFKTIREAFYNVSLKEPISIDVFSKNLKTNSTKVYKNLMKYERI